MQETPYSHTEAGEAPSRVPEPLLPALESRPEPASGASAELAVPEPVPREHAFDQQANEVHVHIGRVEVTAVSEAPPPPRKRSESHRQPMSLDDYLAKRQRDRS